MTAPACSTCRFWDAVPDAGDCPVEGPAWGWCRHDPPRVSDHIASVSMPRPQFGRQEDPEDIANVHAVADATIFPATMLSAWCGQHQVRAA